MNSGPHKSCTFEPYLQPSLFLNDGPVGCEWLSRYEENNWDINSFLFVLCPLPSMTGKDEVALKTSPPSQKASKAKKTSLPPDHLQITSQAQKEKRKCDTGHRPAHSGRAPTETAKGAPPSEQLNKVLRHKLRTFPEPSGKEPPSCTSKGKAHLKVIPPNLKIMCLSLREKMHLGRLSPLYCRYYIYTSVLKMLWHLLLIPSPGYTCHLAF